MLKRASLLNRHVQSFIIHAYHDICQLVLMNSSDMRMNPELYGTTPARNDLLLLAGAHDLCFQILRILLLIRFLRRHHDKILYDLSRQHQSRNGRNERDTSRDCAAFGTFMLCARRADAVFPATGTHVFLLLYRRFCRINDL